MPLSPSSILFQFWKESPVPTFTNIYLFNCTNSDKMMEKGFRPDLVQLGPYNFIERWEKVDIAWNSNHTVSYRLVRRFFYDAENSNGSLDDYITTLDTAALVTSLKSKHWSYFSAFPVSATLRLVGKSVWMTKSVGEYLIQGYTEPLLTVSNIIPWSPIPGRSSDKVGLIRERNGSAMIEGVMNVDTGEEDLSKMGKIHYHNYDNQSQVFGAECGRVMGSVGEFFGTFLSKEKPLDLFFADLCRAVQFDYVEDVTVNGVTGYRYELRNNILDNGTTDSGTWCNCAGVCLPQGIMNTTTCLQNAPFYISYPHFLDADPYYRKQVNGMQPDPAFHKMELTVEPKTGIPLEGIFRLQYNVLLEANRKIGLYRDVPTIMVPILWFDKRFTLPREYTRYISLAIKLPAIGMYFFAGFLLLGLILLASTYTHKIFEYKQVHHKERRRSPRHGMQDDSAKRKFQYNKKLDVTCPEEDAFLSST